MEKDPEITGQEGSHYTAAFWEYDTRIGRRWNVDPVDKPWESSYLAFSGNPILQIDPNGDRADWFQNSKTGDVYYNSDMREGDEGTGAMEGEGWEHLGENGMFENENGDFETQDMTLLYKNGGMKDIEYNEESQHVTVEGYFEGEKAKGFMKSQGYEFNPTQQIIYESSSESYASGPGSKSFTFIIGRVVSITEKSNYMKDNKVAIGKIQTSEILSSGFKSYPYINTVARYEITYTDKPLLKVANKMVNFSIKMGGTHDYRMKINHNGWDQYPRDVELINDFDEGNKAQ